MISCTVVNRSAKAGFVLAATLLGPTFSPMQSVSAQSLDFGDGCEYGVVQGCQRAGSGSVSAAGVTVGVNTNGGVEVGVNTASHGIGAGIGDALPTDADAPSATIGESFGGPNPNGTLNGGYAGAY